MNVAKYISINPEVCHGKPCFKDTRIMVYQVLDMLKDEATFEQIQEAYPNLSTNHIQAALGFAARAIETGRYNTALT